MEIIIGDKFKAVSEQHYHILLRDYFATVYFFSKFNFKYD